LDENRIEQSVAPYSAPRRVEGEPDHSSARGRAEEWSGIYLKAVERWETGLLQLTVALFILLFFVLWLKRVRREKRILQFIEEHNKCEQTLPN